MQFCFPNVHYNELFKRVNKDNYLFNIRKGTTRAQIQKFHIFRRYTEFLFCIRVWCGFLELIVLRSCYIGRQDFLYLLQFPSYSIPMNNFYQLWVSVKLVQVEVIVNFLQSYHQRLTFLLWSTDTNFAQAARKSDQQIKKLLFNSKLS